LIQDFVVQINTAFYDPSFFSFGAAFLWGILSVLLSPCHLGAIPLLVAYTNKGRVDRRSRGFQLSLVFALGLLVMLGLVGLVTSSAGRLMGDVGSGTLIGLSVFLIFCGLWLMDIPPFTRISFSFKTQPVKRGLGGALFLGLVYGVILGPCSFAFLAPLLGLVFSAARRTILYGAGLMGFYALGHTLVIVAAGTFGDLAGRWLNGKGFGTGSVWFKRLLGLLVIVVAVYQIRGTLS